MTAGIVSSESEMSSMSKVRLKFLASEELFARALNRNYAEYGQDNTNADTMASEKSLAQVYVGQHRFQDARSMFAKALAAATSQYGS
jgi:hypothetical protein